ncbi:MAG: hypothetical protein L3J34_07040 [Flavobacteriaceae bacterium]|nr:hypothetical protein [Flavobacteriaceae bacterium]
MGLSANDELFTNGFIEEATELFNQAEIIAESEEIKKRVEMAPIAPNVFETQKKSGEF